MKRIICNMAVFLLLTVLMSFFCHGAVDLELIKANMEKWYYVQFDKGSGTQDDPYIIDEIEDLEFLSDTVFRSEYSYKGKHFRLDDDLYLNDITKPIKEWKTYFPIGWDEVAFEGHFDGAGHTVYGFKPIVADYNRCTGFFGKVKNGSIKNLTLSDSYLSMGISEGLHTAVLVIGFSCDGENGSVENCHVVNPRGSITRLITNLFATNGSELTVKDCTVENSIEAMILNVTASNDAVVTVSGLENSPKVHIGEDGSQNIDHSREGIIENLYFEAFAENEGTVIIENCINNVPVLYDSIVGGYSATDRGEYGYLAKGGILNSSFRKSKTDSIRNCTNNSIISGLGGVGGIAGVFVGNMEGCTNNGHIYAAEARVGGIVGQHTAGDIKNCINSGSINVVDVDILVGVMRFGGIAGVNNGTVEGCINYGDINGSPMGSGSTEMAGIVGRASYVYNCANLGNLVNIVAFSGGIAGTVALNVPEAVVDNCYNAGYVSASPFNSGSVIGVSTCPTKNCYYLKGSHRYGRYTDKAEQGFDLADYKMLSHEEMTNHESFEGFDFKTGWIMPSEKGYPIPRGAHRGEVAIPKETEIDLNGKITRLFAYNIDGSNYYKIRDLAYLLTGTDSNFAVDWNSQEGTIVIRTGTQYTPVGGENESLGTVDRAVKLKAEKALLNDTPVELRAYKIDGSNYFTLREIASLVGFEVDWNEEEKRILIVA